MPFSYLIDRMPLITLMESLGEGVMATDLEGRIRFINKCAQNMFGVDEKEVLGLLFSDIFSIYDKFGAGIPPWDYVIPKVLKTGRKTGESSFYYTTRRRKKFPAAITCAPIVMDGKIVGSTAVFRDMHHEAEIDKAKTEFVSLASHQLRTPLTAIKLFTEILLEKFKGKKNEEICEILHNIEHSNEKMIRLVNNMLNVASIEAGRMNVDLHNTSIEELVSSVLSEAYPLAHARGIKVAFSCTDKNGMMIHTDPGLLRQVVNNIITNAIEYSPDDTKIIIKVYKQTPRYCMISVKDQGIGISKKAQKEVFNRFFRAENAVKFKTESSGLGLYVGKMMMESLGGKIRFQTAEGKGTTFFICLPLKPPQPKKAYT